VDDQVNRTPIEWCRTYGPDGKFTEGYSVNPIRFRPYGSDRLTTMCQKISPGCAHCYAAEIVRRFWPKDATTPFPGYTALGVLSGEFVVDDKQLQSVLKAKQPARVFWGDMTDIFQDGVTDAMLDKCFAVAALTPHLTHMFLTKRPERMRKYFSGDCNNMSAMMAEDVLLQKLHGVGTMGHMWPLPNSWLGVSVENQEQANIRIPLLLETPAAVRFISAEPLLGDLNLRPYLGTECTHEDAESEPDTNGTICRKCEETPVLDWVICGGESGREARPMHPDWARGLRDQCAGTSVPFFFKQWGEWSPVADLQGGSPAMVGIAGDVLQFPFRGDAVVDPQYVRMQLAGKKAAGRLLDGREWNEFPEVRTA
jgi:protein gp37